MRPTSFRGHDIITELVAIANAANLGVEVFDGPAPYVPSSQGHLFIGWAEFNTQHATAERGESDLVGRPTETGEVLCYIAVGSGNRAVAESRARAVEILKKFEAALRADTTDLNGTIDEVDVGDVAISQHQTNEGHNVGLTFTVSYMALI